MLFKAASETMLTIAADPKPRQPTASWMASNNMRAENGWSCWPTPSSN
ncbi:hypothetical protein X743_31305 [Mesorhizobium sp. LNHC252B00]|nr:hypothetical protein X743_31305 [Mesorhizobium sp. LNHC252B00]